MKFRTLYTAFTRRLEAMRPRPLMGKLRSELFVVVYPTGTDAEAFVSALNRHPFLLCHPDASGPLSAQGFAGLPDALLGKARESRELAAFQAASPEAYLYKYAFDSRGHHAVGFKVEQDSLLDSSGAPMRNALMQDADVRVILYAGRNLLSAYVATLRRQQGAAAVTVAPQAFLQQAQQVERMNDYVERLFQGHRKLKLDADQFASPARSTLLAKATGFLGLETLTQPETGITPSPLHGQITNAAEVAAALAGTPYAWMLEA
jgi:hypothetical protein